MNYQLHPTVAIEPSCRLLLGDGVTVEPFVYLGCRPLFVPGATAREREHSPVVRIGDGCKIGSHATIYRDVEIGRGCLIGTGAIIREGARIGSHCVIGAAVEVSYEAEIGDNCRVMSQSFVVGRTKIGAGSFLGVGVVMSNDRRVDLERYHFPDADVLGPQIGSRVMVGSGANLTAGVRIGDGALIGSGALVTKDVPAGAVALSRGSVAQW